MLLLFENNTVPTVRYDVGSLMIQQCFSPNGLRHLVKMGKILKIEQYIQTFGQNIKQLAKKPQNSVETIQNMYQSWSRKGS